MSADATGWTYRHSPFRGAAFAVHLAIADSVNDVHENLFWMARANIAVKARVSGESVSAAVAALSERRFIEPVDDGMDDPAARQRAGRPTRWRFLFPEHAEVVYENRRKPSQGVAAESIPTCGTSPQGSRTSRDVTQEEPKSDPNPPDGALFDEGQAPRGRAKSRKTDPRADALTSEWYDALDPKPLAKTAWVSTRGLVDAALKLGWTEQEIRAALAECGPSVAAWKLEQELDKARKASAPANPAASRAWFDKEATQ